MSNPSPAIEAAAREIVRWTLATIIAVCLLIAAYESQRGRPDWAAFFVALAIFFRASKQDGRHA